MPRTKRVASDVIRFAEENEPQAGECEDCGDPTNHGEKFCYVCRSFRYGDVADHAKDAAMWAAVGS